MQSVTKVLFVILFYVEFVPKFFVGRGTNINANGPEDNWENEDVAIDLAVLVN